MKPESEDRMQPEYDIRGGVRGKYFRRYWAEKMKISFSGYGTSPTTSASGCPSVEVRLAFQVPGAAPSIGYAHQDLTGR